MAERNDRRWIEDLAISFAMYCDENVIPADECLDLAERAGSELESTADDLRLERQS